MHWLNQVRAQGRTGVSAPQRIHDVRAALDEMRLFKDLEELQLMRRAAGISAKAHVRAMRATEPGKMEYEIEAELLYEFRRHGAQFPAYWPIVAGGANACVLHYNENSARLDDGALLLIDAGCELDGYASDITRSFPVNGKFSAAQKDLYDCSKICCMYTAKHAMLVQTQSARRRRLCVLYGHTCCWKRIR